MASSLRALARGPLRTAFASSSRAACAPRLHATPSWLPAASRSLSHSVPRRSLAASTSAAAAPSATPPASPGGVRLSRAPSAPEEERVGMQTAPVQLTERAAERLAALAKREQREGIALRVEVTPGGCHGYQYRMDIEEDVNGEEDDFRFTPASHSNTHLLVDSHSLWLLKGSTIDYATELIGSQFVVQDNPQVAGAGCGCGVSFDLNVDAI